MEDTIIIKTKEKKNDWKKSIILLLSIIIFTLGGVEIVYLGLQLMKNHTNETRKTAQTENLVSPIKEKNEISYEDEYFYCPTKIDDKTIIYPNKNSKEFQIVREQCQQIKK